MQPSQPFSDHFLEITPIRIQFKFKLFNVSTATHALADLTRWRHGMKYFPHYRGFVREIQLFSLMPAWMSYLTNSRCTNNLRCHNGHVWITYSEKCLLHTDAWTKRLPFCRKYFQYLMFTDALIHTSLLVLNHNPTWCRIFVNLVFRSILQWSFAWN